MDLLWRQNPIFCKSCVEGVKHHHLRPPRLASHCSLSRKCMCISCSVSSLNNIMASCSAIHHMGSRLAGLKSIPKVRPHCKKRMVSMMKENAPMTLGWYLSCWKHDLTSFACMAMLHLEDVIWRFNEWMRKLVMTMPNVQSSSVPTLVDVMRLTRVGCSLASKMS